MVSALVSGLSGSYRSPGQGSGWGVLPVMAYAGRLRPKGEPFQSTLQVHERVGISRVEVDERVRKSVI